MPLSRVAVTGGGTAGHVVPAIPIMQALLGQGCEVFFVGGATGPERELVAPLGVSFHAVSTGKLRRYLSLRNVSDALRIPLGVCQAWRLLRRLRPQVLFSKGGFASFPAVVGAWLNGVPVVAHESDLTPGLANRLAMPFIRTLCVNFDATGGASTSGVERVVVSGTPLRSELLAGDAERGRAQLGFAQPNEGAPAKPVLLVVGGSLGAAALNDVVRAALRQLLESYRVVHVCGAGKLDADLAGEPDYVQREFVGAEWGDVIAAADLVVSRAGANSLCEWLALGKPHLLVPLPKTASRGDQLENAAFAESKGWSLVLPEHELNATTLVDGVARLASLATEISGRLATFRSRDSVAIVLGELQRAAGVAPASAPAQS